MRVYKKMFISVIFLTMLLRALSATNLSGDRYGITENVRLVIKEIKKKDIKVISLLVDNSKSMSLDNRLNLQTFILELCARLDNSYQVGLYRFARAKDYYKVVDYQEDKSKEKVVIVAKDFNTNNLNSFGFNQSQTEIYSAISKVKEEQKSIQEKKALIVFTDGASSIGDISSDSINDILKYFDYFEILGINLEGKVNEKYERVISEIKKNDYFAAKNAVKVTDSIYGADSPIPFEFRGKIYLVYQDRLNGFKRVHYIKDVINSPFSSSAIKGLPLRHSVNPSVTVVDNKIFIANQEVLLKDKGSYQVIEKSDTRLLCFDDFTTADLPVKSRAIDNAYYPLLLNHSQNVSLLYWKDKYLIMDSYSSDLYVINKESQIFRNIDGAYSRVMPNSDVFSPKVFFQQDRSMYCFYVNPDINKKGSVIKLHQLNRPGRYIKASTHLSLKITGLLWFENSRLIFQLLDRDVIPESSPLLIKTISGRMVPEFDIISDGPSSFLICWTEKSGNIETIFYNQINIFFNKEAGTFKTGINSYNEKSISLGLKSKTPRLLQYNNESYLFFANSDGNVFDIYYLNLNKR